MPASLTLVSHALCPYVQRIAIALAEKDVPHDRITVDLSNKPDWFLTISPLGRTPVLKVGEAALFESTAILEYLEDLENKKPIHIKSWFIIFYMFLSFQSRYPLNPPAT